MDHHEPYDDKYDDPEPKHSGFGIASFVIALAAGLLECVLIAVAAVLDAAAQNGIDEQSPEAVLLSLALFGGLLVALLGAGLGIAGLYQRRRKKAFAILGVVINSAVVAGVVLVMIVGLIMG